MNVIALDVDVVVSERNTVNVQARVHITDISLGVGTNSGEAVRA